MAYEDNKPADYNPFVPFPRGGPAERRICRHQLQQIRCYDRACREEAHRVLIKCMADRRERQSASGQLAQSILTPKGARKP